MRASEAEREASKLQKEVDRLEGKIIIRLNVFVLILYFIYYTITRLFFYLTEELLEEKLKYKSLRDEMEVCFQELQGM